MYYISIRNVKCCYFWLPSNLAQYRLQYTLGLGPRLENRAGTKVGKQGWDQGWKTVCEALSVKMNGYLKVRTCFYQCSFYFDWPSKLDYCFITSTSLVPVAVSTLAKCTCEGLNIRTFSQPYSIEYTFILFLLSILTWTMPTVLKAGVTSTVLIKGIWPLVLSYEGYDLLCWVKRGATPTVLIKGVWPLVLS